MVDKSLDAAYAALKTPEAKAAVIYKLAVEAMKPEPQENDDATEDELPTPFDLSWQEEEKKGLT